MKLLEMHVVFIYFESLSQCKVEDFSFDPLRNLPKKRSVPASSYRLYSIIRLYRTRLYRNSVFIEVQLAVSPDTMLINTKDGYIETRIYRSIHHGPLNFDIRGLYCTKIYCIAL